MDANLSAALGMIRDAMVVPCPDCGHEWTWHGTRAGCMEVVVPGVAARYCGCRTREPTTATIPNRKD